MPLQVGNIQIFMGPQQVGGPDNLEAVITNFIDEANDRLDIAVQELESRAITDAIIRAKVRGVSIRIFLESSYLVSNRISNTPFDASGNNENNRDFLNALYRSNIDVKTDYNPKIFHQKFIIRDGSFVLTGSTNFTNTGTSTNLNHIIIVESRGVVNRYRKEFEEILRGRFGKESKADYGSPDPIDVGGIPVKVLFAPDHAPEMEIMKQMLKAQRSIHFAIFTFSQSSGIDDAMIALAPRQNFTIRGAMDGRQANQSWAATHPIHRAGVELFTVSAQAPLSKLHHKLMVIDQQLIIAGSFNYTGPANYINDENILIIGDLESTNQNSIQQQQRLANYAITEIERIISTFGVQVM